MTAIAHATVPRPDPSTSDLSRHSSWSAAGLLLLLGGYLFLDRPFAHLHIPGTPIYLAEPILAFGVVGAARSGEGRRLLRYSTPIRALIGFIVWGLMLLAFHVFDHGLDAVQDSAVWYYGLFAVVAGTIVLTLDDAPRRLVQVYASGLAVFVVLGWVRLATATTIEGTRVPDSTVPWTGHRQGNIAVHAAIGFAFAVLILAPYLAERLERRQAVAWTAALATPLLVLYFAAGTQNRGGLVAGFFVIIGVPMLARRFGPIMAAFSLTLLALFTILYLTDVSFDLGRRGRPLSVQTILDNIVSVREGEDTGRTDLWDPVIDDILTEENFLTGRGFGENLGERYGFKDLEARGGNALRNVHNSHLNVLARMGFIGAGLWLALWIVWYYHLFRARSRLRMVDSPRRAAWLGWAMLAATAILINAFFDGTLEGPQVAVWLWSIYGIGAAIAMETNIREWQRRRAGVRQLAREGGGSNPLEVGLNRVRRGVRR